MRFIRTKQSCYSCYGAALGAVGVILAPVCAFAQTTGFPQPPIVGFSPRVAVTVSNRRIGGEFNFDHTLQSNGYVGSPLSGEADSNYVIGVLDTGAITDVFGGEDALAMGISGVFVTPNSTPLGGLGGIVDGPVTERLGVFAQGLGAIDAQGKLNLSALKGHTNASGVILPVGSGGDLVLPSLVGTGILAFYDSVIRTDTTRSVLVDGQRIFSPDVQIVNQGAGPTLSHQIALQFGGPLAGAATTASYYPDILNLEFEVPWRPTVIDIAGGSLLSGGGAFFANMGVLEGEPGPINPIQNLRMLVDTGAQASIISKAAAANLSLDLNHPDFTQDVGGIGGVVKDVPGFYIDFAKINASGGALSFNQVPVLVEDLASPEGTGTLDGILGMNVFWDRNLVFKPSLTATGFLEVSEPVIFKGDLDGSGVVDAFDVDAFELALADLEAFVVANPNVNPTLVGDVNGDGEFNAFDVTAFEQLLASVGASVGATVPEPGSLALLSLTLLLARRRGRVS